jgi:hypothetical protein
MTLSLRTMRRPGRIRRFAFALVLAAACAARLHAQDEVEPDSLVYNGAVRNARAVSHYDAMHRCLDFGEKRNGQPPRGSPAAARFCTVVRYRRIGLVGGVHYSYARYHWSWTDTLPPTNGSPGGPVTFPAGEIVVFARGSASGPLRPIWHGMYPEHWFYRVYPQVGPAPGGGALLGFEVCWNGTAGCSQQHFLLRRDGRITPVRERWSDQLPRSLRARLGYSYIDPLTRRGQAVVRRNAQDDARWAVRWLRFRVAVRGRDLVLRGYHLTRESNDSLFVREEATDP